MSTAWKGPVVLLREPPSAFWARLGYRLMLAAVLGLAASYMPYAWLAVPIWVLAGLVALLALLAVVNLAKNERALLVFTGAGSIEWPRSIQEILLRRPLTWVAGPVVVVTQPPVNAVPGRMDPRVTLTAGDRAVAHVPLYGLSPADFVTAANAALAGRGTELRFDAPEPIATSGVADEAP